MAREQERRLKVLRQKVVLSLSTFIVVVIVLMYIVIQPVMVALGINLALPDGKVVFVLLVMAGTGLALFDAKTALVMLSSMRISFKEPAEPKAGGDE